MFGHPVPMPVPDNVQATVEQLRKELQSPLELPTAHQRVLREALVLMNERGYAGASLRELARRVEMSQPSLYHYFESKEQLVEQVIRFYVDRAMRMPEEAPLSPTLAEGLRYGLARMIENFESDEHRTFIRFLLAVGRERPEVQQLSRELMLERGYALMNRFVEAFVSSGEVLASDSRHLVEMVTHSMLLRLLRDHVLFPDAATAEDTEQFADFIVDTAVRGVRARLAAAQEQQ